MSNQTSFFKAFLPYGLPFIVFALFTYLPGLVGIPDTIGYPLKTLVTLGTLAYFWKTFKGEIRPNWDLSSIMAGVLVYIIWVGLEGKYTHIGPPSEYNPWEITQGAGIYVLLTFRLAGAALVVPVMEELFWRSFALRFLIRENFKKVPLGTFSWFAFIGTSVAFGLEHNRWLPGILAGMIYALVLFQKKNLFAPILAHGVTNFFLGIHVIVRQEWGYW
ncbi:MAG: CAAX prenyl protease-related protein [Desulfobacterales bacterium]|nr:CAAX prenyl protease-related protein [Desulfobacterales bacterium]